MYRLAKEGVVICFEDSGKGAPPLVMIHDLGGDHSSFAPQVEYFRRDHRVVSVDLRGHGKSDKPDGGYSIRGLAADVGWLCYELGLYAPVVIGHGLGGMIAIEMAGRSPELPGAVVAVNSLLLPPPETVSFLNALGSFAERLPDKAYNATLHTLISGSFLPTGDLTHRSSAPKAAAVVSRQAASSALQHALAWDGEAAISACRVPILYVDGGTGAADLCRLTRVSSLIDIHSDVGAGHFLHLQHAEQFNSTIDQFVKRSCSNGPSPP